MRASTWPQRIALGTLFGCAVAWLVGYKWPHPAPYFDSSGCQLGGEHPAAFADDLWWAVIIAGLANAMLLGRLCADASVTSRGRAWGWFAAALVSIGLVMAAILSGSDHIECGGAVPADRPAASADQRPA